MILVLTEPPTMAGTDVASVVVDNRNEIDALPAAKGARY